MRPLSGPFPSTPRRESNRQTLDASARVSTPYGWLELNDGPYRLGADSFAQSQLQMRRNEVTNPYASGKYTTSSVKDSYTESISVYVYGNSWPELRARIDEIVEAFTQNSYRMSVRFEQSVTEWRCNSADVSVQMQKELAHARMATVTASFSRMPNASSRVV